MNPERKSKTSRLTILFIMVILSYPAVIQADYGLIYILKARILSQIAVLLCIYGYSIDLLQRNVGKRENHGYRDLIENFNGFPILTLGIALYTLSAVLISVVLIYWSIHFAMLKKRSKSKTGNEDSINQTLPDVARKFSIQSFIISEAVLLFVITAAFSVIDIQREYSVWHHLNFRFLPTLMISLSFSLVIIKILLNRKN